VSPKSIKVEGRRGIARSLRSRWAGERASAAIEFALVLPLVLTMVLALLQVGLLVKDQLILEGAARAGAREAAVNRDDDAVRQTASDAAVSLEVASLEVAVERQGGTGSAVTVRLTYHEDPVVPIVGWLFPETVDLTAAAVMRQETE
jgi:Flp pilus assembly protein TadG